MAKKFKMYLIALLAIVMCISGFFGLSTINVFAFSGTNNILSEQELYNLTNTYNVSADCFKENGEFKISSDCLREKPNQYKISYNLSEQNNNQVMELAQITVLTHGLDSNAGTWSNHYTMNNDSASFAYDCDSLISKIDEEVGAQIFIGQKVKLFIKATIAMSII